MVDEEDGSLVHGEHIGAYSIRMEIAILTSLDSLVWRSNPYVVPYKLVIPRNS